VIVSYSGSMLSRGSDMQKYIFKRFPGRLYLGFIRHGSYGIKTSLPTKSFARNAVCAAAMSASG
jgi:hypothetical protein